MRRNLLKNNVGREAGRAASSNMFSVVVGVLLGGREAITEMICAIFFVRSTDGYTQCEVYDVRYVSVAYCFAGVHVVLIVQISSALYRSCDFGIF